MYVIVVGAGKIGFYLTRALLAADHEVTLIERDPRVSENAVEEFGSIVITSDGTEPSVLKDAGGERADILISTTGRDSTNLVACQVAKWSFATQRTVAVVTDPDHVPLFKQLGVDVTISTTDLILSHVEEEISGGPLVHLLPLRSDMGVVSIRLPHGSPAIDREISRLDLPPSTLITAVVTHDGELRPGDRNLTLAEDDEIIAITPPEQERPLWQALTGGV